MCSYRIGAGGENITYILAECSEQAPVRVLEYLTLRSILPESILHLLRREAVELVRVERIELSSRVWKTRILTVVLHPRRYEIITDES